MSFVLDLLAFALSCIIICVIVAAVILTGSFVYVCIKSAKMSGNKDDKYGKR